jgi:hypothetical protein
MYNVYGENKKNVPNCNTYNGKHVGPDKLHADGIKKMAIKGRTYEMRNLDGRKLPRRIYTMLPVEKEENCPFRMTIYLKKKYGLFYLSRHGSGPEHKGHSKKTNVKISAVHMTKSGLKSGLKTVKSVVQSHIKARGAESLLEKLYGGIYSKASRPPNEKIPGRI